MRGSKAKLTKEVWNKGGYYQLAREGSLDVEHPGMKILKSLAKNSNNVLDLGCGEGTRLHYIAENKNGWGVDISKVAISQARKNYPKLKFEVGDLEKLFFKDEEFDLVYSAYVLEHVSEPEKILSEAMRVLKKGGSLVLICPNYGSPNRCSPCFKGSRLRKLFFGFWGDLISVFKISKSLEWNRVEPIANNKGYHMDYDTTIEPYLRSLAAFVKKEGLRVEVAYSCWSQELGDSKMMQRCFRFLGELHFYPFVYWGPHIVLVAKK